MLETDVRSPLAVCLGSYTHPLRMVWVMELSDCGMADGIGAMAIVG